MRIFKGAIPVALMLSGCGGGAEAPLPVIENTAAVRAEEDGRILCALGDGADFVRGCAVLREQAQSGVRLTITHPDGGFRRFDVVTDGRGLVTTDGAEPAIVSVPQPGRVAVQVGQDRYILPAKTDDKAGTAQP